MRTIQLGSPQEGEALGAVKAVSQDDFAAFVTSTPYAVIKASTGATPPQFPASIALQLGLFHRPAVHLGVVDLETINWTPSTLLFARLGLKSLELQPDHQGRPPVGYYLFAQGVPIAYHPGNINLDEDQSALGWGGLLKLAGIATKNPEIAQLGQHTATWKAGERVAKAFSELIERHQSGKPLSSVEDELAALTMR